MFDHLIRNARRPGDAAPVDIAIRDGRIARIAPRALLKSITQSIAATACESAVFASTSSTVRHGDDGSLAASSTARPMRPDAPTTAMVVVVCIVDVVVGESCQGPW